MCVQYVTICTFPQIENQFVGVGTPMFPEVDCGCGQTGQSKAKEGAIQVSLCCCDHAGPSGGHPRDIAGIYIEMVGYFMCA